MLTRFSQLTLLLFLATNTFAQCDATKRPIVMIHGFLASGDTWAGQVQRFVDAGYCADRLFLFDWNSVGGNGKRNDSLLNAFIDDVLNRTGSDKVDLLGHSAGGSLGRGYLVDSLHALKIAHYVHLGSRKWFADYSWYSNAHCLNIYSAEDKVAAKSAGDIAGATNLDLKDKDHYEVATSRETFEAIYRFLNNAPATLKATSGKVITVSGKAVMLGDNTPLRNAQINVYRLKSSTGVRLGKGPVAVLYARDDGCWGSFNAKPGTHYEFELVPEGDNQRIISYYYEPFTRSNDQLYLRAFPKGNMMATMLGAIPQKEDASVIVIYSSAKAMVAGRDSVTVNGIPVCTQALSPANRTVISHFIFDDGDGNTSGGALKQFSAAPFLGGADIYLPAVPGKSHKVYYNGRKLVLPAASSAGRILLAVFN